MFAGGIVIYVIEMFFCRQYGNQICFEFNNSLALDTIFQITHKKICWCRPDEKFPEEALNRQYDRQVKEFYFMMMNVNATSLTICFRKNSLDQLSD